MLWELSIFDHIFNNREHARSSWLQIIRISSVKRPHETVAIWVKIDNKDKLSLLFLEKLLYGLCLFLREWLFSWVCLWARRYWLIQTPVNAIVSIKISSLHFAWAIKALVNLLTARVLYHATLLPIFATNTSWTHIFPLVHNWGNLSIIWVLLLNQCNSINIDHWQEVKLAIL